MESGRTVSAARSMEGVGYAVCVLSRQLEPAQTFIGDLDVCAKHVFVEKLIRGDLGATVLPTTDR
jgi:hypothetical protein